MPKQRQKHLLTSRFRLGSQSPAPPPNTSTKTEEIFWAYASARHDMTSMIVLHVIQKRRRYFDIAESEIAPALSKPDMRNIIIYPQKKR